MKKRMVRGLSLVIAVVLCFSLLPVTALAVDSDFEIVNGVLVKYHGTGGDVVIPRGVTSIGDNAFRNYYHYTLTSVTIPDGVTSIGDSAFSDCGQLTSVALPSGLISIGDSAFYNCYSLVSITLPGSVKSIGEAAFRGCRFSSVTIPDGVTAIRDSAFYHCIYLASVTIPNSVKSIGAGAFYNCLSLTGITLPNGITSLGDEAFAASGLTSIKIPDSVTSFGRGVFRSSKLASVTIPKNVTSISQELFAGTALTSITIPDSVTSIGASAFSGTALTSVIVPDSVTSIGGGAFSGCMSLASVTIPASVTTIGYRAFLYNAQPATNSFAPLPNLTIYGKTGSTAEAHAKEDKIPFVSTGVVADPAKPTEPETPDDPTPPPAGSVPNLNSATGWAHENLTEAYNLGLIPSALQARYTQATTRAEFAALAVTLYETVTGRAIRERKTFTDTTDINVEKAAAIGVVDGVGNNRFDPNAKLTREQAAVMLARLAAAIGRPLPKKDATFADSTHVSSWAIEQVGQIQAAGIMGGVGSNTFDPKGAYTREQSIVTILRLHGIVT